MDSTNAIPIQQLPQTPLQPQSGAFTNFVSPSFADRPPAVEALEAKRTKGELRRSSACAYAKDIRLFIDAGGAIPCDATLLRKYISATRTRIAPQTLYRRCMAVRHAHIAQDLPSPTDDPSLRPVLRALQLGQVVGKDLQLDDKSSKALRRREPKSAKPMTRTLLLRMLDAMHRNSLDRRDRALVLLGFMGALKRAELVALDVSDLTFTGGALLVSLKGRQLAIPSTGGELCAVAAVRGWIEHAALDIEQPPGPLFRRFDRGGDPTASRLDSAWVSVVVKTRLKAVGIEPDAYSAQSLRRGRLLESANGVVV